VRVLLVLVLALIGGLLAEALFDSAIGAWVAVGAVFVLVGAMALSKLGLWPADWPDLLEGGD